MAQLTKQDVADVVEEVLDRKLNEKLDAKFDEKLGLKPSETLDSKLDDKLNNRLGLKPSETLDSKLDDKLNNRLGLKPGQTLDSKLDDKFGAYIEHVDDRFDGLTDAISLINENIGKKADQSDLDEVKDDIRTIKLAVRETNRDMRAPSKHTRWFRKQF